MIKVSSSTSTLNSNVAFSDSFNFLTAQAHAALPPRYKQPTCSSFFPLWESAHTRCLLGCLRMGGKDFCLTSQSTLNEVNQKIRPWEHGCFSFSTSFCNPKAKWRPHPANFHSIKCRLRIIEAAVEAVSLLCSHVISFLLVFVFVRRDKHKHHSLPAVEKTHYRFDPTCQSNDGWFQQPTNEAVIFFQRVCFLVK